MKRKERTMLMVAFAFTSYMRYRRPPETTMNDETRVSPVSAVAEYYDTKTSIDRMNERTNGNRAVWIQKKNKLLNK